MTPPWQGVCTSRSTCAPHTGSRHSSIGTSTYWYGWVQYLSNESLSMYLRFTTMRMLRFVTSLSHSDDPTSYRHPPLRLPTLPQTPPDQAPEPFLTLSLRSIPSFFHSSISTVHTPYPQSSLENVIHNLFVCIPSPIMIYSPQAKMILNRRCLDPLRLNQREGAAEGMERG